jgi:hypothetical protein
VPCWESLLAGAVALSVARAASLVVPFPCSFLPGPHSNAAILARLRDLDVDARTHTSRTHTRTHTHSCTHKHAPARSCMHVLGEHTPKLRLSLS